MTDTPSPDKKKVTGWQRTVAISLHKGLYYFSKHWIWAFNFVIGIYVGLPILAPILMNAGITAPAQAIYTVYKPFCHQMVSRSFFIGGEQYAYPRPIAGTSLKPIDDYLDDIPEFDTYSGNPNDLATFLPPARAFVGNEQLGYKMALCERDISIYGFLLLGGILYGLLHKRYNIKPLNIWVFLIIGMGPIALDGFSQLFAYMFAAGNPNNSFMALMQGILPLRESTPLLRSFTGGLFGLMLAWLSYPRLAEGMEETYVNVKAKLQRAGELPAD